MELFSYYNGDIYNPFCVGHINIKQFVNSHKNPKPNIIELFNKIKTAAENNDLKLKNKLKAKLFYFTPSVYIEKDYNREYKNIKHFTGYAQLDFDKLDGIKDAQELKHYLFHQYNPIICCYLSPSRLGVKAIIKIPKVETIYEYKEYYKGIEEEMIQYDGFDKAPKNSVLPLYLSHDKNILFREDYTEWNYKGDIEVDYVQLNDTDKNFIPGSDGKRYLQTINLFKKKIDEIADSDGHPRMRDACLVLGSRAGAGYIDLNEAELLAETCIRKNSYLIKKYKTYLKTAIWAVRQGYNNPKYY